MFLNQFGDFIVLDTEMDPHHCNLAEVGRILVIRKNDFRRVGLKSRCHKKIRFKNSSVVLISLAKNHEKLFF